jgi:hypothetical protein
MCIKFLPKVSYRITSSTIIKGISTAALLITANMSHSFNNSTIANNETYTVLQAQSNIYPAVFFEQYQPQNAMDMVARIPGFNFNQDSKARGFGGNAGNVLVDGARPTSKSGGLKGALKRIPAAQVTTIEIIRGGVGAGGGAGQSVVANVIRDKSITIGTWASKLRISPDGKALPNIEAAMTTKVNDWNVSFDLDIGGRPNHRKAVIEELNNEKVLTATSTELFNDESRWFFANGEGTTVMYGGKLAINGRLGGDNWQGDTNRESFIAFNLDESIPESFWQLNEENKFKMAELSMDWTKSFQAWKWRIVGLGLISDKEYGYLSYESDKSKKISNNSFTQNRFKTEIIARTTIAKLSSGKFKPEFGVEIANNKLDTSANETEFGLISSVEGADVIVEELRGELFTTFSYSFNPSLTFEGAITAEFSTITVSGESEQEQSFEFIKPRLSATYKINDDNNLTVEAEHSVGQLNFNDFSVSTEASDDSTTSGNPDLKPDQKTRVAATYDWSFSERGSLKVKAFYQWKTDILEQVILARDDNGKTISQALGNAGDARFWGIITDINLPLDFILPNGLLEVSYKYKDSSFDDDITNQERTINDYTPNYLGIKLRQDLNEQKIAWGVEYQGDYTDTDYRVDEFEVYSGNKRLKFFVETTRFFDLKTQIEIAHLNTGRYTRSRFLYDGDRSSTYLGSEIANRVREPEIKLSIWGAF